MSDRQGLEAIRQSSLDALCSLHLKMCERALSIQQIAEVGAWSAMHKAASDELKSIDQNIDVEAARHYLTEAITNLEQHVAEGKGIVSCDCVVMPLLRDALQSLGG